MTRYLVCVCGGGGGRGGTRHLFLLPLYNSKNIGGGGQVPSRTPYTAVSAFGADNCSSYIHFFLCVKSKLFRPRPHVSGYF